MSDILRQGQDLANLAWKWLPALPERKELERVIVHEVSEMLPREGQMFVRLAGLSGAIAVAVGAYGAHVFRQSETPENLKLTFETGNRYHFLHTLALLAVPLTRRPYLTGTLLAMGTLMFSGSCYYHALTGNTMIRRVTPYGGMLLIVGWASMVL